MIRIALIGSTGSVGRQVLDVVRSHKENFSISALVCGSDRAALARQAAEFSPRFALCAADGAPMPEDLFSECDVAFIAAGGFVGLSYTLAAVGKGKKVALANKESLVCGGEIVMKRAAETGAEIVPVDSEHSAIFQALSFRRDTPFSEIVLTASGGPFLRLTEEEMKRVTPQDALRHPNWKMGPKITVDSATMLNKGYEVIEAKWLYGAGFERIRAVVHPESVVHSIVCFEDGAAIAQLGYPDMRLPIQLALTYPARLPCCPQLDFARLGALHFERLPEEKFPCFGLALQAGKAGGTCPTILNGAAETAVHAFLGGSITFPQIADTIKDALDRIPREEAEGYDVLAAADRKARKTAERFLYAK